MVVAQLIREPVDRFLSGEGPIVDVRSPTEFQQGHVPGARNLPLFSDEQRAAVGTTYKQQGRQAAVQLGLELVGPRLGELAAQLTTWASDHDPSAPLRLHCWRGGMRSESVAWLAGRLDLPVLLLDGGYKAFRRWVLERFEASWPIHLLGGRTGSGKTDLLLALADQGAAVIDLEGLAHHRGSSFGSLGMPPQPSTEHYENQIAVALDRYRDAQQIWLEAESAQVGRCRIPASLWNQMQQAPLLEVQRPLHERLEQLVAVYGVQEPQALYEATQRIARRLGPQRTTAALEAIEESRWADAARQMLDYYDRCYDHELQRHGQSDQQRLLGRKDLACLSAEAAATQLINKGLVETHSQRAI
jgi:tRNA 2-selenouridine synthase